MQELDGIGSSRPDSMPRRAVRGVAWWGAVSVAVSLTAIGAVADMRLHHVLGLIFQVSYGLGCVAAVCAARRGEMFGPMVQPPLIMACVAPPVVLLWSQPPITDGLLPRLIAACVPVVDNFLIAAGTTALTVVIGLLRMLLSPNTADRQHTQARTPSSGTARRADWRIDHEQSLTEGDV